MLEYTAGWFLCSHCLASSHTPYFSTSLHAVVLVDGYRRRWEAVELQSSSAHGSPKQVRDAKATYP